MIVSSIIDSGSNAALHEFRDTESQLHAFVAIDDTSRGPAFGGCRYWHYGTRDEAIADVLRLARGMSYKNALADLPFGGGKAVLLRTAKERDPQRLFAAFGRAVDSLAGKYITAEDVGTTTDDMAAVATTTRYVAGLERGNGALGGDPSPHTSRGVFLALVEAWREKTTSTSLRGVTVAVQGLGNVGYHLAGLLFRAGARLCVADPNTDRVNRACSDFGAHRVDPADILAADVDVLAPCALGGVLNEQTTSTIKAKVIAGAANNQLATPEDAFRLHRRGILYAPDYVINAGGIIAVAAEYLHLPGTAEISSRIARIPVTLGEIFSAAARENVPPAVIADARAEELLHRSPESTTADRDRSSPRHARDP